MQILRIFNLILLVWTLTFFAFATDYAQPAAQKPLLGPTKAAAAAKSASIAEPSKTQPIPMQEAEKDNLLSPPIINVSADWSSKYVYQGKTLNNRPVGIFQAELNKGEAYFGMLSIYDFSSALKKNGYVARHRHGAYDSDRKWRFQENRFYVGDTMIIGNFLNLGATRFDLNWTYIQYPTVSENDSAEISVGMSFIDLYQFKTWQLVPSLTATHDYELENSWISGGLLASFLLTEKLKLDVAADLFWGDTPQTRFYTGKQCNGNAFYASTFGITFSYSLTNEILLSPYLKTAIYPDSRCRHAMRASPMGQTCEIWGGLALSIAF